MPISRTAIEVLLAWATDATLQEQREFAQEFETKLAEYYVPKDIPITSRVMEALIENWAIEYGNKTK